jgi:hypothetical protein
MSHGPMLFPELAEPKAPPQQAPRAQVIRFTPRPAGQPRREASRLDGDGLALRLRRDVERQLAHRRRMLGYLEEQRNG